MNRFRMGLPVKFVLTISVVIVLTSLSLTLFFIKSQISQIRIALEGRASTLARNIAINSELGVLTDNEDLLVKLCETTIREQDVLYSVIYDTKGKTLAYAEGAESRKVFKEIEPLIDYKLRAAGGVRFRNRDDIISLTYTSKRGEPIHDAIIPIVVEHRSGRSREEIFLMEEVKPGGGRAEMLGFARVGISMSRMNRQIMSLRQGVLLLTCIVIVFGILLSAFMVRLIVRPIRQLALGTQKIAAGDLNYKVEVSSHDEIGELATMFNQMASDLQTYIKALYKEKEDLLRVKMALEHKTNELEDTLVKMKNIQQELLRSEKYVTIGRLASSVAHDLRNPLASLKNISYYLMKRGIFAADDKAKQMLEMLAADVSRANKIVTDLLDFSREKKLNKVPADIDGLVKQMLAGVNPDAATLIASRLDPVRATVDPDRVLQVLSILIANAIDAVRDGGTISVATRTTETAAEITVTDTGCGMDDEALAHLFEPLFTTKLKGMGLGLAIAKEIVDAHCGTIKVHSEKGKGTAVVVAFPLK